MDVERLVMKLVGDAKFHLRKKLEDEYEGALPVIEIPYSKMEFRRIKENFSTIQQYANVNHMDVSFVKDGSNHLRWAYKFESPLFSVNNYSES